ncbi:MAG: molybdenum cofactor guanylyltransferase [Calditrichia bacterium]
MHYCSRINLEDFPIDRKKVTAAIIGGGKSTRFGSPKLLALYRNQPLVAHMLQLAAQLSDQILAVCGNLAYSFPPQIRVLSDLIPDCGPLGGVDTALQTSSTDWLFTLPGDVPLLPLAVYQELWKLRNPQKPVVAFSERGIEPLVALWPVGLRGTVRGFLEERELRLRFVLRACQAVECHIPERLANYRPEWFANVNTIDDLNALY